MTVSTLLRSWLNRRMKRQRTRAAVRRRRPWVELLESRELLSGVTDGVITPPVTPGTPGNPGPVIPGGPGSTGQPVSTGISNILLGPLVTRLYADLLHRAPAPSEQAGWVAVLAAGATTEQVAAQFTGSDEYRSNLIRNDYETYLGREPDAPGLSYWLGQLDAGVSEVSVAAQLAASDEFYRQQGTQARLLALGTPVTNPGATPPPLVTTPAASPSGTSTGQPIAKPLTPAGSTRQPSNAGSATADRAGNAGVLVPLGATGDWLAGVYGVALGRAPDAGALAYWNRLLQARVSRETVAYDILTSPEALTWVVADGYYQMLQRGPDAGGTAWWVTGMAHGLTPSQLVDQLAGSQEYNPSFLRIDSVAPPAVTVGGVADQATGGTADGSNINHLVTVQGTGTPGSSFVLAVDGVANVRGTVGPTGTWSVPLPFTLTSGTHVFRGSPTGVVSPFGAGGSVNGNGAGGSSSGAGSGSGAGSSLSATLSGGTLGRAGSVKAGPVAVTHTLVTNVAEEAIAVDPANPNLLFAAGIAIDLGAGQEIAFSTDGGNTWRSRLEGDGTTSLPAGSSDPAVAWDAFGNLFWAYINDTAAGGGDKIILNLSTDGGKSFTNLTTFSGTGGNLPDQPVLAVGAKTVWIAYDDTGAGNFGRETAAGAAVTGLGAVGTFGAPETAPGSDGGDYDSIAISPSGQVIISYESTNAASPAGPGLLLVNTDPDGLGPLGFNGSVVAATTQVGAIAPIPAQPGPFNVGGRTIDAEPNLAWDRSNGPYRGRVYMVFTDSPAVNSANTKTFVVFSGDSGNSWSSPVKVSDDTGPNSEFLPFIAVDQTTGHVGISWYDSRNDNGKKGPDDRDGLPNTDAEEYLAVSTDGGATWSPNLKVASGPSNSVTLNPNAGTGSPFNFGDYTGLDFFGGVLHPIWADNSTTLPQGSSPIFTLATASIPESAVGGVGAVGANLPEDRFEPNDTSDKATNFGFIGLGAESIPGLTITRHVNGQPDYDWFVWVPAATGTFTAQTTATNDQIELHLFVLRNGALVEVSASTAAGATFRSVGAQVAAGELVFVEVKPRQLAQGVFGQANYDLAVGLQ